MNTGPKGTQRRFKQNKHSFDNQAFIEDVYQGQNAFVRRDDEEKVKELITFTIRRIKQVLSVPYLSKNGLEHDKFKG